MMYNRDWWVVFIGFEDVLTIVTAAYLVVTPTWVDFGILVAMTITTICDLVLFVRRDRATEGRW